MNIDEVLSKYYKSILKNNLNLVIVNMKVIINRDGSINVIGDKLGGYLSEEMKTVVKDKRI